MSSPPAKKIGYLRPLFEEDKPKWTDDRMIGGAVEKTTDIRYHDKEKTIQIVNGLCADIFFQAEDVEQTEYKNIPDCALSGPAPDLRGKKADHKKPLDSKFRNRTYILSPELPAPVLKARKERVRRRRRR